MRCSSRWSTRGPGACARRGRWRASTSRRRRCAGPPPSLGEHGAEVLRELGLSASEIEDLRAKQILG